MRRFALLLALTACRIGFDHGRAADAPTDDAPTDDAPTASCMTPPCNAPGIYRSVGPGATTALAQSTGNAMTITGGTATFESSVPDRVGVGDVIQYDSTGDGASDSLAFIHERISATEYLVASETGGLPSPASADADWAIFRAYVSLNAAGTGTRNPSITFAFDGWGASHDLTALGLPWHIACYADAVDTTNVFIGGWATSATAYLRIFTPVDLYEVGVSQRHPGRWDNTRYSLQPPPTSNNLGLAIEDAFARIEGLQIFVNSDNVPGDLPYGISFTDHALPRVVYASHNLIRGNNTATPAASIQRGIKLDAVVPGQTLYAFNNVIYDFGAGSEVRGIETTGNGGTVYSYNNTLANLRPAFVVNDVADRFIVRNTVAIACPNPCLSGLPLAFMGSNNIGTDFDDEGIGAAPGSDVLTDYFVATDDFHLAPSAPRAGELVDQGADLSMDPMLRFDHDIDRGLRTPPWDIGADER